MNTVHLLDMPAFLRAIERQLETATTRIFVETYIFRSDHFSHLVGEQLAAAANRGVRVRLLFDGSGSREGDPRYIRSLEERGVQVRPYRRTGQRLGRLSPSVRDHSRILVIDDVAYTGGYAFADPWLPVDRGGQGWHESSCRVRGPVVEDFSVLFEQRWAEALGSPPRDFDTGARHPDVRLISDGPLGSRVLEDAHLEAFESARERIWIENAYCYPSARYIEVLARAAQRHVDVKLVLSARSTVPIVARAARAAYRRWLRAGLRIFEYLPTVLHGKVALVDDTWGTVGTYNANPASVRMSLELNVSCSQPGFLAALSRQLERDLSESREVTSQTVAEQSPRQRYGDRIYELALKSIAAALGSARGTSG